MTQEQQQLIQRIQAELYQRQVRVSQYIEELYQENITIGALHRQLDWIKSQAAANKIAAVCDGSKAGFDFDKPKGA